MATKKRILRKRAHSKKNRRTRTTRKTKNIKGGIRGDNMDDYLNSKNRNNATPQRDTHAQLQTIQAIHKTQNMLSKYSEKPTSNVDELLEKGELKNKLKELQRQDEANSYMRWK